jgi:hypothetical protein
MRSWCLSMLLTLFLNVSGLSRSIVGIPGRVQPELEQQVRGRAVLRFVNVDGARLAVPCLNTGTGSNAAMISVERFIESGVTACATSTTQEW